MEVLDFPLLESSKSRCDVSLKVMLLVMKLQKLLGDMYKKLH